MKTITLNFTPEEVRVLLIAMGSNPTIMQDNLNRVNNFFPRLNLPKNCQDAYLIDNDHGWDMTADLYHKLFIACEDIAHEQIINRPL